MAFMRDFVRRLVADQLNGPPGDDLLQVLIEPRAGNGQDIRNDGMSLLIAGQEPPGAALWWLFALLADHPAGLSRCQTEVAQTDDLQQMPFLAAVFATSRRWPADDLAEPQSAAALQRSAYGAL